MSFECQLCLTGTCTMHEGRHTKAPLVANPDYVPSYEPGEKAGTFCSVCFQEYEPTRGTPTHCRKCARFVLGLPAEEPVPAPDGSSATIDRLRREIKALSEELAREKQAGDHLFAAMQSWQKHAENRAALIVVLRKAIDDAAEKGST